MLRLRLNDQLQSLIQSTRERVESLPDESPLKHWFSVELEMLSARQEGVDAMEEVSARMRAVRQIQHMVHEQLEGDTAPYDANETEFTALSRVPAWVLGTARQTSFSIEPALLLLNPAQHVDLFDAVSPTAKVVSYLRSCGTGLAFAQQLTCAEQALQLLQDLGITDAAVRAKLAVLFACRYQCINAAISRRGVHQVLEIAAGITPRGLDWSRRRPGTVFIESDLPALMRVKAKALRDAILQDSVERRGVLHCCGLNALDLASIQHALEYTDPRSELVIVTEGMLLYFDDAELQRFLSNMRAVLTAHPRAVWVVDMVSRAELTDLCRCDAGVAAAIRSVFALTNRSVIPANPFENESAIDGALRQHDLHVVAKEPLSAAITQGLVDSRDCSPADANAILGNRKIWTIAAY